jgi:hypothetical protein
MSTRAEISYYVQTPYRPVIEVIEDGSDDSDGDCEDEDDDDKQPQPLDSITDSGQQDRTLPQSVDVGEFIRSERLFCELEEISKSAPSATGTIDLSDVPDLEDVDAAEQAREERAAERVLAKTGLSNVTTADQELEGLD